MMNAYCFETKIFCQVFSKTIKRTSHDTASKLWTRTAKFIWPIYQTPTCHWWQSLGSHVGQI